MFSHRVHAKSSSGSLIRERARVQEYHLYSAVPKVFRRAKTTEPIYFKSSTKLFSVYVQDISGVGCTMAEISVFEVRLLFIEVKVARKARTILVACKSVQV